MKGLYQKKGSAYWYYQAPTPKGGVRPKAMALGTTCEATAINSVTDMQWQGMILAAESKDTLAEVLPRYYRAKAEDRKKTRQGREQILDAFKDLMGNPRVSDISKQMILDWRKKLAKTGGSVTSTEGVSQTTMTSYLIAVRAFLNWCVEEKILRTNPTKDLGKQSAVRVTRRQKFFTVEERELLLARPRVNSAGKPVKPDEDYIGLILHLGFFAGLRIGEMLAFQKEWLYLAPDGKHGSLHVQVTPIEFEDGTKGEWRPKTERGIRSIPLHPRLIKFLKTYGMKEPFMLAPWKPLFPEDEKTSLRFDPKRTLHTHGEACGLEGTAYHKLRHSFGTHLAMGGETMVGIAALLGNTVKVASDSYAGYSPRTKNALPGV